MEWLTFEKFIEVHPLARGLETEQELRRAYIIEYISFLKQQLNNSDYKAIKYSEGLYTDEEYEPIKRERENIREKIRKLETQIEELKGEL